jgi:hypothetical protein
MKKQHEHDVDQDEPECCKKKSQSKNSAVTISSGTCGSAQSLAIFGMGHSELLPSRFCITHLVILEASLQVHSPVRQADWPGEPPDPPPRLS